MQTALHIAALVSQLKREIVGGSLVSTEFYKKLRAAYFFVKHNRFRVALGFVYHPAGSGCFCVPASKVNIDTREKPWPIFALDGAEIIDVVQPSLDRVFEIEVAQDGERKKVVIEALGPNGNIWLLNDRAGRLATLRNRKFKPGERYESTPIGERVSPFEISGLQIVEGLAVDPDRSPLARLKSLLAGFNETMVRETLARAGLTASDLRTPKLSHATKLAKAIGEVSGRFYEDHHGYLYDIRGAVEVYPFKLVSRDVQPQKYKTLSAAIAEMVNLRQTSGIEADEEKRLLKAVARAIKRQQKLISNLERDVSHAADYERYKRYGELLQLNRGSLKKGMKVIEVEDVLSAEMGTVTIELDAASSPNENIENYFRKYRKGREGLDLLKRRLEIVADELESLLSMQTDLETDFDSALQRYEAELLSLLPRDSESRETAPRLPYRPATLSSGLTIFIGRDGADNDRTTFDFARPHELWFHTQQCAGSHVVMKYPNKSFEPSKREIEETAAIAAYHSKARKDSLVPVIYTQRRYVRKPRKAKPGLVMVERESSVMVVPQKETRPSNK